MSHIYGFIYTAILLAFHLSQSLHLPFKSVILTPTLPTHHSTTVSLQGVVIENNEWRINHTPHSQSFLLINLDNISASTPHHESVIIITINGYSITADNMDFITSFNVKNQYITTKISLNNAQNNQIFPICDNAVNIPIADHSSLQIHNISYSDMKPLQLNNGYINSFPLQFTIRNSPNNTLLSYKSLSWTNFTQFCGFQSFETHSALKIYITAYDIHQQFAITSINITYTISNSTHSSKTPINDEVNKVDNVSNDSPPHWMHDAIFKYSILLLAVLACVCLNCIICLLLKQYRKNNQHLHVIVSPTPKPTKMRHQAVPSNTISNSELPTNIAPTLPSVLSYSFKPQHVASTSPSLAGSVYFKGQLTKNADAQKHKTITDGDLEKEVNCNKQERCNVFIGNLTRNDKQRSAASDGSEVLHVIRSEFGKGAGGKSFDFHDDSMENVQSQLSINKKYLYAQSERSREVSYMTDNSMMLLEINMNLENNKMSRNMSHELGSELSRKSTPIYNENECDMIIKSPFNSSGNT